MDIYLKIVNYLKIVYIGVLKVSSPQEPLLSPQESTGHTHTHTHTHTRETEREREVGGWASTVVKQEISIIQTKKCPCLR